MENPTPFPDISRSPRPRADLLPIRSMDLDPVCAFLNERLNQTISAAAWKNAYAQSWMTPPPNHGFMLVDENRVVGAFMALHAERIIRGRIEKWCNLGNWVVLEPYRAQSLSLMRAAKAAPDTHYTLLAPNETVARIFATQRFVRLSDRITILSTMTWPTRFQSRVIEKRHEIMNLLPPDAARDCLNHRPFPWLRQLALGDRDGYCHIIHKPFKQGRFKATHLLHSSDGERFIRHYPALARHLLFSEGITSVRVPGHLLPASFPSAREIRDPRPRLYFSNHLDEREVSFLYTELLTLDRSI
ncbi:MAG: hypothetical protein HQL86_09525 [Magnetococcales bacterium]|nr:hypothetical protein [Magnetococcales bacterium]